LHRILNTACIVLSALGTVCIFAARGWAVNNIHQILGFICLLFTWSPPSRGTM
jgi:hypothetical protein